jgi:hypothetical protein
MRSSDEATHRAGSPRCCRGDDPWLTKERFRDRCFRAAPPRLAAVVNERPAAPPIPCSRKWRIHSDLSSAAGPRKETGRSPARVLNDYCPRTPIDIIFYPSVAFRGGLNFAVLPGAWKSKTKLVSEETRIIEITDVLGYGIYKYKQVGILNSNTSNGELDWKRL